MLKFLREKPLFFALVTIGLYVFGMSAADELSRVLALEKCLAAPFSLLFAAGLFCLLKQGDLLEFYGLCRPKLGARRLLFYLPLVLISSVNFWFGISFRLSFSETALYVLSMLGVGFLEEVIFRGLLYRALEKDSERWAIFVSSVTFGIGHIVNLVNGSGAGLLPTLCQVVYATAFGFLTVALFRQTKSLWACIFSHAFVNATSVFSADAANGGTAQILSSLVLTALCLGYAIYLFRIREE